MHVQSISQLAAHTAQLYIKAAGTAVWKKNLLHFELYLCIYYNEDIIPASPGLFSFKVHSNIC